MPDVIYDYLEQQRELVGGYSVPVDPMADLECDSCQ